MKQRKKISLRFIVLLVFVQAMAGCIKEDMSNCPTELTFTVRAYDSSGAELTSGEVDDVCLFVFNGKSLCLIERIDAHIGETVTITAPEYEDIHIVGWGNVGGESGKCADVIPGDHKDMCYIYLLPNTRSAFCAHTPADLFRGEIWIDKTETKGERVIPIRRETGSMSVTVRSLKTPGSTLTDEDYYIQVKETGSAIDFYGTAKGDKIHYLPTGTFVVNSNNKEEYHAAPFNMIPEPEGVTVEIYKEDQLVTSVAEDKQGNKISVHKDKLTNVLIDLSGTVSVKVTVTDWGNEQVEKEF
ncbi:MAG: FimB/Mfa2 family fimbrial subunit [Bacteroides intestinalis]|nr:FimB/Mfa2 family fimbrial subunit [Bacteroides intestinalis]